MPKTARMTAALAAATAAATARAPTATRGAAPAAVELLSRQQGPALPVRHSWCPSQRRRAVRVAAAAGPPRLGAPLQLGSPASQKRREEILTRIDDLIQEELDSQLVGGWLVGC